MQYRIQYVIVYMLIIIRQNLKDFYLSFNKLFYFYFSLYLFIFSASIR